MAASAAALLAVCGLATPVRAADLSAPGTDYFLPYTYGGLTLKAGVMAVGADGRNAYCIEAGEPDTYDYGEVHEVGDSDEVRRLAWLADAHRTDADPVTQAAIAVLVHDHLESKDRNLWSKRRAAIYAQHPQVASRVDELWAESAAHLAAGGKVTYAYVEGRRSGYADVTVTNASGAAIDGVGYTVSLDGPAVFDATGSSSVTGVTGRGARRLTWTATGNGEVSAQVDYDRGTLERLVSSQDYVRFGGTASVRGDGVMFDVVRDFQPMVSTEVETKVVEAGRPVVDRVTSSVADGDVWKPGVKVVADGYYFASIPAGRLDDGVRPEQGESADSFLVRLKDMGFVPEAYAVAEFTGPGQTVSAQAMTEQGGSTPYVPDGAAGAGFGTWVWSIEKGRQADGVAQWLRGGFVSPLLEQAETLSARASLTVDSTVTEHSAVVGSDISDRIAVAGFPDDHGKFTGDREFGFGPDAARAQVSVYWAGDAGNPAEDERYKPSGDDVPAEDEHHRLVGTWEYPAVNGVIRVGGGAPDADGNPVRITAPDHGYYVFVYRFGGDDRVAPVASSYGDAWERVYVSSEVRPHGPALVTAVMPPTVRTGEGFRDGARITGALDEGMYVTFSAYGPVGEGDDPSAGAVLLDEARVDLDVARDVQTVLSPVLSVETPGKVYWKATLWDARGDVVDSHPLGVDGEITTVVERETPPDEDGGGLASTGVSSASAAGVAVVVLIAASVAVLGIRHRRGHRDDRGMGT